MTIDEFSKYRFSINSNAKIINQDDPLYGYIGRVMAINFTENLVALRDEYGDDMWKRCENVDVFEWE